MGRSPTTAGLPRASIIEPLLNGKTNSLAIAQLTEKRDPRIVCPEVKTIAEKKVRYCPIWKHTTLDQTQTIMGLRSESGTALSNTVG